MGFTVQHDKSYDCIIGVVSGQLTEEMAREYVIEVRATADAYGVTRLVTDLRGVDMTMPRKTILALPKLMTDYGMGNWRRAVILERGVPSCALAYKVHGQHLEVFRSLPEALEWISS